MQMHAIAAAPQGFEAADLQALAAVFARRPAGLAWTGYGCVRARGGTTGAIALFFADADAGAPLLLTRAARGGFRISGEAAGVVRLGTLSGLPRALARLRAARPQGEGRRPP